MTVHRKQFMEGRSYTPVRMGKGGEDNEVSLASWKNGREKTQYKKSRIKKAKEGAKGEG